ncbi:MAG: hypothetical protein Kow0092_08860 [Deferrisomatales bacterium]
MTRDPLDRVLRDLGRLYQVRRIYPGGNRQLRKAADQAARSLTELGAPVRLGLLGDQVVAEDRVMESPPGALVGLLHALGALGAEGLHVDPGASAEELEAWIEGVVAGRCEPTPHVRAGSFRLESVAVVESATPSATSASWARWIPQVQESLGELARRKADGLALARDIVGGIAGSLALGAELPGIAQALRVHDGYTFSHALNVCVVSAAMARALGAAPETVQAVALAALCHDVGKEAVPPEILNKETPLTEEERQTLSRHPLEGARILLEAGVEDPLLPVVACQHHRGADGSGYPRGPAWARVHPASLLVAVADVYDALRTERPYRPARTLSETLTVMWTDARRGRLHGTYFSVLVRQLGAIGSGCVVRLSDGRSAEVVRPGGSDPFRPVVAVEGGRPLDLDRERRIRIVALERACGNLPPGGGPAEGASSPSP